MCVCIISNIIYVYIFVSASDSSISFLILALFFLSYFCVSRMVFFPIRLFLLVFLFFPSTHCPHYRPSGFFYFHSSIFSLSSFSLLLFPIIILSFCPFETSSLSQLTLVEIRKVGREREEVDTDAAKIA